MHRDKPGDIEQARRGGVARKRLLRLPSVIWRQPRSTLRGAAIAALVGALLVAGAGIVERQGADAQTGTVGQWSAPFSWPNVAIHSTLLPTGKVLTYSYPSGSSAIGESESWLWNPSNSQFTEVPVANGTNIFCSAHALLPDGQVVSFGGTDQDSPLPDFWGQNEVNRFNTATQQWSTGTHMSQARWYPQVTTLSDGKLLISSGVDQNGEGNDELEVYNPSSGTTTQLPSSADRYTTLYPWQYLLPNGRVLSVGNGNDVDTLNLGNNTWSNVDDTNYGGRDQGTSVLLPLKAPSYNPEVVIMGGGNPSTNSVERINMGASNPTWANQASMAYSRRHANSLLLPNGKVLVTGGTATENDPAQARKAAELYDPAANSWTTLASQQKPRMYHSMSMLLPDARVLTAGTDGELTAEIYSPPYLFNGARPTISSAPASVGYGASFQVSTPNASSIAKVMLMKPSSVTHSVNMGQRAIELSFTAGSGSIGVTAPPNGNIAPPGHYMLFILNGSGVPSVASWVHVSGSPAPTPTPSPTPTPTPTPSPTPTKSPSPTPTKSPSPTPTKSPSPTPTKSPSPTPSLTPNPTPSITRADLDCDGAVTSADAVKLLRHVAGLPLVQGGPCPPPGTPIGNRLMGDIDCSGSLNAIDAILISRIAAGLPVALPPSCPPITVP